MGTITLLAAPRVVSVIQTSALFLVVTECSVEFWSAGRVRERLGTWLLRHKDSGSLHGDRISESRSAGSSGIEVIEDACIFPDVPLLALITSADVLLVIAWEETWAPSTLSNAPDRLPSGSVESRAIARREIYSGLSSSVHLGNRAPGHLAVANSAGPACPAPSSPPAAPPRRPSRTICADRTAIICSVLDGSLCGFSWAGVPLGVASLPSNTSCAFCSLSVSGNAIWGLSGDGGALIAPLPYHGLASLFASSRSSTDGPQPARLSWHEVACPGRVTCVAGDNSGTAGAVGMEDGTVTIVGVEMR